MSNRINAVVVYDMHTLLKHRQLAGRVQKGDDVFINKIGSLDIMLSRNGGMMSNLEEMDFKVKETFDRLESKNPGNLESILDSLKRECRFTKREGGFAVKESYTEALDDDPGIKYDAYLLWLEKTIIEIEEFNPVSKKENPELDALKAEYKEVFGKAAGNKGIETIKKDLVEANN